MFSYRTLVGLAVLQVISSHQVNALERVPRSSQSLHSPPPQHPDRPSSPLPLQQLLHALHHLSIPFLLQLTIQAILPDQPYLQKPVKEVIRLAPSRGIGAEKRWIDWWRVNVGRWEGL